MGRLSSATVPISIIKSAMTLERTGRSMKNLEIMARSCRGTLFGRCLSLDDLLQLRIDLLSRDDPEQARDHDAVLGLQAALDHAQPVLDLPRRHLALLDRVVT